jgi:Flp pilus assembly protein TadG
MVEMALLITAFLAILLGIMDWSWTMFEHESIVSRAAQAARWAAVRAYPSNNTSATNIVLCGTPAACTPPFGLSAANVAITQQAASYTSDNGTAVNTTEIVVTVSGYTVNHCFMGGSFNGRTITASALYECPDNTCNWQ